MTNDDQLNLNFLNPKLIIYYFSHYGIGFDWTLGFSH